MAKRTIYFIDDLVNNAIPLIKLGLAYYKSKRIEDVNVHLIGIVPLIEGNQAESECEDFLTKNKNLRGTVSYSIITYAGDKKTFDSNNEKFYDEIFKKIRKTRSFSVGIDLMLFDNADTRRVYDYGKTVLSHRLAKKFNGRCALYSSLQGNSVGADYETWNKLLTECELTANFFNIPDHAHVDHEALFNELYILAK